MPLTYVAMVIQDRLHCLDGNEKARPVACQCILVLEDKWYRDVSLEPTLAYQIQDLVGCTASGPQTCDQDVGVEDDVRNWHDGTIYATT